MNTELLSKSLEQLGYENDVILSIVEEVNDMHDSNKPYAVSYWLNKNQNSKAVQSIFA